MITRIMTRGIAGGADKEETGRDKFSNANALDFLSLDLSLEFRPIEIKDGHILLEQYSKGFTKVEHVRYEGTKKDMRELVTLAKAAEVAATAA